MNPYSTHEVVLKSEIASAIKSNRKVHVLEFGCGEGSSQIIHSFAKEVTKANFMATAFESDEEWLKKTEGKYNLPNYEFNLVDWGNFDFELQFSSHVFDIVFIDQSPWEARIKTLDYFFEKGAAKTIILHDYDYYNKGITENILDVGKGSFFEKYLTEFLPFSYSAQLPPTLILKNKSFFKNK